MRQLLVHFVMLMFMAGIAGCGTCRTVAVAQTEPAEAAIVQLSLGMREDEIVALLAPVSREWTSVYEGGRSEHFVFFLLSERRQVKLWIGTNGTLEWGRVEPRTAWLRRDASFDPSRSVYHVEEPTPDLGVSTPLNLKKH